MVWLSLGQVLVSDSWQSFPEACLGYETFKLEHNTIVDPIVNSCFLAQYFPSPSPGGRYSPWRRIWPSTQPTIIELPIPQAMKDQGVVVYDLQVRWRFPYFPVPWTITLYALV